MSELHLYPLIVSPVLGLFGEFLLGSYIYTGFFEQFFRLPPVTFHVIGDSHGEKGTAVILYRFQHPQRAVCILPVFQQGVGVVQDCHSITRELPVAPLVHRKRVLPPGKRTARPIDTSRAG